MKRRKRQEGEGATFMGSCSHLYEEEEGKT